MRPMRRSAASERPPHQIGGPPGWRGGGCIATPSNLKKWPSWLAGSPLQSLRSTARLSLSRAPRSPIGTPQASYSLGKLAADTDAEDEPALGQVVERRDLLGHRRRMAERQQVDPVPKSSRRLTTAAWASCSSGSKIASGKEI